MHEVAQEKAGALKAYRVNARENMLTCVRYAVSALPQLLFFVDGKEKTRSIGAVPKGKILAMLAAP